MDHPLGKVLASGNGKGNRAIYAHRTAALLVAVLSVAVFGLIANDAQNTSDRQRTQADNLRTIPEYEEQVQNRDKTADTFARIAVFAFWFGIVLAFVSIFGTEFYVRGFAKTKITVYEKGIAGIGCGIFYELTYRTYRFQLTYDEITSISTLDWPFSLGIVIHAPNARYRCYVMNPSEIQMAIGCAKFGDGPIAVEPEV